MSDRTHPIIGDHLRAIEAALVNESLPFPVNEWERPKDGTQRYDNPPFAVYRIYPSADEFTGPLSDSQADITLRFQILGVGFTHSQATDVTDICRGAMKKSKISVPNRRVMDVKFMVVTGGESRDDDLPTAFHYSSDLYQLRTTPA